MARHAGAAFLAGVLGEVPDKVSCIRSLPRVLKPDGFSFAGATGTRWQDIIRFTRLD